MALDFWDTLYKDNKFGICLMAKTEGKEIAVKIAGLWPSQSLTGSFIS
jgi:hypothetical protein